jgi:hypothetical protein
VTRPAVAGQTGPSLPVGLNGAGPAPSWCRADAGEVGTGTIEGNIALPESIGLSAEFSERVKNGKVEK